MIHSSPGNYQTGTGTFRLISDLRLSGCKSDIMSSAFSLKLPLGSAFSAAIGSSSFFLSDLKQHKFILSHFWRSDVWNQSHWAKVKVSEAWFLLEALRGDAVSLPFSSSGGCLCSLARGPFLQLQSVSLQPLLPSSHCLSSTELLCPS